MAEQTPGTYLSVAKGRSPRRAMPRDVTDPGLFEKQLIAIVLGGETGPLSKHMKALKKALENDEHGAFAALAPRIWDRLFGRPRETVTHEGGTTLRVVYVDE